MHEWPLIVCILMEVINVTQN